MQLGLPNLTGILGMGAGAGLSASSSATAQGGKVGDFVFRPKAGISPLVLLIGAAVVLLLMKR